MRPGLNVDPLTPPKPITAMERALEATRLELLYLIFDQLPSWLTQLGRTTSTKDIELLVLRQEVTELLTPTSDPTGSGRE